MATYQPQTPPADPAQLAAFMQAELLRIKQALDRASPSLDLEVLHAEPDRIKNGMIVEADGTDWNPGSGAGTYILRSGAWVKLG